MMYVPTYLTDVKRDFAGWPDFVDGEGKEYLETKVIQFLTDKDMSLSQLVDMVFDPMFNDLPNSLRGIVSYDLRYAAVHRALLSVEAKQVYTLKK